MQNFSGKVISTKMKDTIIVALERQFRHPKYKKILRRTTKFLVHCENGEIKEGDVVSFLKAKPFSKNVHFKLSEILKKKEIKEI